MEKKKYYENVANTIIKNFKKRQIKGFYCPDKNSAVQTVLEIIPKGASIGWGGSETVNEIGLIKALSNENYNLIDRDNVISVEEQRKKYGEICCSDYFLMSTNAITLDGELINVDGKGNRVAFLCYGPQNVLILTGMNKVVTDIESGGKRARNIAAPPNAIRLKRKTPCAINGKCEDCYSTECMCGQFVITRFSLNPNRIKVVLIGEELGY